MPQQTRPIDETESLDEWCNAVVAFVVNVLPQFRAASHADREDAAQEVLLVLSKQSEMFTKCPPDHKAGTVDNTAWRKIQRGRCFGKVSSKTAKLYCQPTGDQFKGTLAQGACFKRGQRQDGRIQVTLADGRCGWIDAADQEDESAWVAKAAIVYLWAEWKQSTIGSRAKSEINKIRNAAQQSGLTPYLDRYDRELIRQCVNNLKNRRMRAIANAMLDGATLKEAAGKVGIKYQKARSLWRSAKDKLRELLSKYGFPYSGGGP